MQQLSIIIANWNTGDLLFKCLSSIASLPEQDLIDHVVIIDNASSDDSMAQASEFAREHGYALLPQERNLGFAKANNLAWNYITEHGGNEDHVLLLNPDTEVHPGAIKSMLAALDRNPSTGIVGPKLLEATGEVQLSVRQFPTLSVFALLFLKLHRIFPNIPTWKRYMMADFDYTKEQVVDQVMGAAFLIRNTVAKNFGLLDESFWIWFEEVDFCKRAKQAGFHTIYTPRATIIHHGGTSFGKVMGFTKTKLFTQSSLLYARKHLGILSHSILLALYPFALFIGLLASLREYGNKK